MRAIPYVYLIAAVAGLLICGNIRAQPRDSGEFVPLYISYNLAICTQGKFLPTSGGSLSIGFNIAGARRQSYVLGLFVEVRLLKFMGTNSSYAQTLTDVNANRISTYSDPDDSTRAEFLFGAFNSDPIRHFRGSYLVSYGIMYSPFPDKAGGFMLSVKRGHYEFPISGAQDVWPAAVGDSKWSIVNVPFDYSIQLSMKPFTLLPSYWSIPEAVKYNVILGFYCEQISVNRTDIRNNDLNKYLAQPFFDKYGTELHYGIKLSFGFY